MPFFGYAIALLGFNLLFGYTGLLSFGHAMFLGLGAYGAAVIAGVLGIKSLRGRAGRRRRSARLVVALPIGLLCVRYTGIFFGMLTLAFGMLAHSFLFKFYHLTGGDSGMRVPRMRILGLEFDAYNKIELLAGPFYYYCLALLVIAGFIMWRIVHSPFGLHLRSLRDNAQKAEYLGVRVRQFRLAAFVISAVYGAIGGAILGFRIGLADPELVLLDALGPSRVHDGARRLLELLRPDRRRAGASRCCRTSCSRSTQYWRFVLGAILALIVIFFPARAAGHRRRSAPDALSRKRGGGRMTAAARNQRRRQALRRVPRARRRVSLGRARRRVRLDRRAQRRRQDHAGQPAHRPAGADQRRGAASRATNIAGVGPVALAERGMARTFQLVQIFPAAHRGRDHRRRRGLAAGQAVAAVLAAVRR